MTDILVPAAVPSLDLVEDHVRHPDPALAMAILETSAQMNHVLNVADTPAHLRIIAPVQIPATMTLETICIPLARSPEVHL
jgi:hypothetical protein